MTRKVLLSMIFLFLLDVAGVIQGWANSQAFSMVFHFAGGGLAAMLVVSFYNNEFAKLSQPVRFFSVVALTLMIGIFWEFAEYLGNKTLTDAIYRTYNYHLSFIGDLDDTIQDLAMDTLGAMGFLFFWFGTGAYRKGKKQAGHRGIGTISSPTS